MKALTACYIYRFPCRDLRQSASSKNLPSPKTPGELLREFTELYRWSLDKSIYSALRVQGGMDNFDYHNKVMVYDLRYRAEFGGNPGLSFILADAAFRSKDEIDPNAAFTLLLGQSALLSRQLTLQRTEKDFVGLVVALYQIEGDFVFLHHEIYRHTPKFEESVAQLCHDVWLAELQKNIQHGFIFSTKMQGDLPGARLGRMKLVKSKWSWVPLSNEEVSSLGLATMSSRGIPGEGFAMMF